MLVHIHNGETACWHICKELEAKSIEAFEITKQCYVYKAFTPKGDSLPYAPIYLSMNKFCNNVTCKYAYYYNNYVCLV